MKKERKILLYIQSIYYIFNIKKYLFIFKS